MVNNTTVLSRVYQTFSTCRCHQHLARHICIESVLVTVITGYDIWTNLPYCWGSNFPVLYAVKFCWL